MNTEQWKAWHQRTKDKLLSIEGATCEYRKNIPCRIELPAWPAFNWSWHEIREKVGDCHVEYQRGRTNNPNYEIQSHLLRHTGPFKEFLNEILYGAQNDVYMTAQNSDKNTNALAPLFEDIDPLPSCLTGPASRGFFWIGGETITPLHHDLTNNLMCQIIGHKLVRVVAPDQIDKLDYLDGVHSNIGWLSDVEALDRGIDYTDIVITPETALFLPVGLWHCVKTDGPSVTVVYTSFKWDNNFAHDFH